MTDRCLDLDIGNSRTKWRFADATGSLKSPGIPSLADIDERPRRVRISAVAGVRERITNAIQARFDVTPEFAEVSRELAGVVCCYDDPHRLGIDRWLALVAAWRSAPGAVAVVDAGTAITVDLVAANGQHQGGYIAPGIGLMRRALAHETRDLAPPPPASLDANAIFPPPGKSTDAAITAGTLAMPTAFIDAILTRFTTLAGPTITTFLCGGDAPLLHPHLTSPTHLKPTLVLDGLTIALP